MGIREVMSFPWGTEDSSRRHVDWNAQSASRGFSASTHQSVVPPPSALSAHVSARGNQYQGDALDSFTGKTQRDIMWEKKRAAFQAKKGGKSYGAQGDITNQTARLPSVPLITHTSQPAQPHQGAPPASRDPYADQPASQARYGRRGSTQDTQQGMAGSALNDVSNHSARGGGQAAMSAAHYQQAQCAQQHQQQQYQQQQQQQYQQPPQQQQQ